MAVATTLRRPEWNRRLYGTANITVVSRAGIIPGMYLLLSGDTTVMVVQELPNLQFKVEIIALPRGKTRSIFKAGDTVGNVAAPVINSMVPNTAPHNVAVQVKIYATGIDAGATVFVGATQLTPTVVTPAFVIVTFTAASIAAAGTAQIKVQNSDGIQSAAANFTVT